jgi:ATP-dependent helicase/DNAse subunit B
MRLPVSVPPATAILDSAGQSFAGNESREPSGVVALDWLEETLTHSALKSARFGTPAIYIGTLRGTRGLAFRAVRIVGLVEGSVPSATREDPVLSDAARAALSPFLLSSRERAHQQLAAFDDAVRSARERIAFSAPRVSMEGSVRQPAAVLLDVIRALSGSSLDLEKKLEELSHAGRQRERRARELCPVSTSAALDRIARGDLTMARAEKSAALSLDSLRSIRDRSGPTAQDGLLGGAIPVSSAAGLSAERPISASRLFTLLTCPHQFLYEHVLGLREPENALRTHSLDNKMFGTWLHAIAEQFWHEHGIAIGARREDLSKYQVQLRELASRRFDALLQTYPFANNLVANAEREALCDQLNKLLALDWNEAKPQTFIAVERAFGYDAPCQLETAAGPLFVRGKIDKLDLDGKTLLVRDIKTGAGKPRRADDQPDPGIDLQVAVYALVAKQLASEWGTPDDVAVAYMYLRSGESDRSWKGPDYAKLEQAAREWLATAREILASGAFARTPNRDDCSYCAHKPVCASEVSRAEEVLHDPRVPRRLKRLKLEE